MTKKEMIRSGVGPNGMLVYLPKKEEVGVVYDRDGDSYKITIQPSWMWTGREELFNALYFDEMSKKDNVILVIRIILEVTGISIFPVIIKQFYVASFRQSLGISLLTIALFYFLEFCFFTGLRRKKSHRGRRLLKYRGALNKALNAMEKYNTIPTIEQIKKASKYRANPDYNMTPHQIIVILFVVSGLSFMMPSLLIQLASIPIFILFTIQAFKTSLFGLLHLTYVAEPEEYEMKMARDLLDFCFSSNNALKLQ